MNHYQDFALELAPRADGTLHATLQSTPFKGISEPFALPFSAEELETHLSAIEARVAASRQLRTGHLDLPASSGMAPRELGGRLFEALFRGGIRDAYLQCRERARGQEGTGLRLRLVIDPETAGGRLLASLPWELLYRAETRESLSRNLWSPVVRFLVTRDAPRPIRRETPLRMLLVSAEPPGMDPLEVGAEAAELGRLLEEDGRWTVRHLRDPDTGALAQALRRWQPHGLHFMGHGGFQNGTGSLVLVADGRPQLLPAPVLGDLARSAPSLRLVCLNACDTARLPRLEGRDPFSGAAAALVMASVPAVVAMQFPISDTAARAFSRELYDSLADGDPVDAAVSAARMAIRCQHPESWEWATPALFLGLADGQLFEVDERRREPAPPVAAPAPKYLATGTRGSVFMGDSIRIDTLDLRSNGKD